MAVRTTYFFGSYSSVRPFIIQINSGADSQFTIPTTGGGYNYKVSTSDGQIFTGVTGNLTITFPSANTLYDVSISGSFPRIHFNNGTQRLKLIDIKQWGDIEWTSMQNAFYGCENLIISASDSPDLSNVTDMYRMFGVCRSLTGLNGSWNWNTSNVTNMSEVFNGAHIFNGDITNWDTSNVTTMFRMFMSAGKFNRDLSSWDMTSVTDASEMFRDYNYPAIMEFNNGGQPLMWKFNKTVNMANWFLDNKSSLNIDITFDFIDAPNGVNLSSLFQSASNMNSQVNILGGSVTNMSYMFRECVSLTTLDVSNWDVSSVTNMSYMFYQCSSLTTLDVSNWDVSSVTNMQQMFGNCASLTTLDVSNWDVSSVTNMDSMFRECASLTTLDISSWDVSSCVNLFNFKRHQISNTSSLTHDILWDSPTTGSISAVNIQGIFRYNKSNKIAMQCGNVTNIDQYSFQSSFLEKLILIDLSVSFTITTTPSVTGTAIDDLANSVADMTGQTSPTITMTTAQYNSCDTTIWTNKNWTIAQV